MKKFFLSSWLVVALSLFFILSNAATEENILINPGFEKDLKGWFEWNSDEGTAKGGISTQYSHSGTHSGKRWLVKPTELTYSCFIQQLDTEVQAGDKIFVTGWMMSPPDDPLKGGSEAFVVIEFWRGTEKMGFPETKRLNTQSQWKEYKILGVVPEGADVAKICCFLFGFEGSKGTVYFDDLKVEIKPKNIPH